MNQKERNLSSNQLSNRVVTIWRRLLFVLLSIFSLTSVAQPRYDMSVLKRENLNRGLVAIRENGKVYLSWRTLSSDAVGEKFEVYRNGTKLNKKPLKKGGTFFVDESPLATNAVYEVKGGGKDGRFELKADAHEGYLSIPIQKPEGGVSPDGFRFTYHANDASVGDVDGDGQYEIFLKWDPSNAKDNSFTGFTGNAFIDCYRLDGTLLWRINLGNNIRTGAHYTQFMVFDFDGDGKAELMMKTADGTIDGKGNVIGDPKAEWRHGAKEILADPQAMERRQEQNRRDMEQRQKEWEEFEKKLPQEMSRRDRNNARRRFFNRESFGDNKLGRIMEGPEYLTVFNGLTGEAMATVDYIPERGEMRAWGDDHANRSERYLAGVAYLDGVHASGIFCRGYYTRTVIAAWDWDGKDLTNKWTFDTNQPQWRSYAGQGNHNLRVADVDGDGFDEITYGSMAVDHDGTGLYNTGFGHGDAIHLTVFDPKSDKLQVWDCHENRRDGSDFRDAATGKVIFQIKSSMDVGRCMAADIDPTNPGLEMWSSDSKGIRTIKGEVLKVKGKERIGESADGKARGEDNTSVYFGNVRLSTNFGIWWDGDLLRELLDRETVTKYNWNNGEVDLLKRFEGAQFNNGTKSNPNLSADIIGDWREEVLTRDRESKELRLYVSTIPTDYRINCLMEDVPYRLSVAAENTAYNQPPETGFYIGLDKSAVKFLK